MGLRPESSECHDGIVLTPEYQKRLVQQNYHEGVSNSPQWMAAFCYPDGLMRWCRRPDLEARSK